MLSWISESLSFPTVWGLVYSCIDFSQIVSTLLFHLDKPPPLWSTPHLLNTVIFGVFSLHVTLFPVCPAAFLNVSLKSHSPAKIEKPTDTHLPKQSTPTKWKQKQRNTPLPSWILEKFLIYYRKCQNHLVCYSRIFKVSPSTHISKLPSS